MSISTPNCVRCGREEQLYSGFKNNRTYDNLCEKCIGALGSAEFHRRYERNKQRRDYAKDIIQTWEPEFIKAYGAEAARKAGWSDEQIRKFS